MNSLIGMRSTADYANNQVQWDWADGVLAYDLYGQLPLTALMSRASTVSTDSFRVDWFDQDYDNRTLVTNALLAASTAGASQAVTVTGNSFLAPSTMMIFCPEGNGGAGETLRVNTDPTVGTTCTVTRGWGLAQGTAVPAIPNGSHFVLVGTASEEGSNVPKVVSQNPYELFNYTQIFKTPYTITGTDRAVNHRTGDPWAEAVAKGAIRHMKDIEFAMFFGARASTIGPNGEPLRTMGGLNAFIQTNRKNYNNAGNLDTLTTDVAEIAKYGNRDIFTICGDQFISRLNVLIRGETNYMVQEPFKLWGYDVTTMVMPNAITLRCITHPLLNGLAPYRNSAWLLNMADLGRRPLRDRDTHVVADILPNGTDGEGEQLLTEMTMTLRREKNFGIILNL